jgi:hypothetical protein
MKPNPEVTSPLAPKAPTGADRRRTPRYQVDLPGTAHFGEAVHPVVLADLSLEGALIVSGASFPCGAVISLAIDEFGIIDAKVVHAAKEFCGVQFVNAHLHRDRLAAWLRAEVGSA